MKAIFLSTLLAFSTLTANAFELTETEKLRDFDQLVSLVENSYGPLNYKAEQKIVNYDRINSDFRQRIIDSETNYDFYYLMVEYVGLYKDGHFNISLPTNYTISLPVATELVDNKVLISDLKANKLPKTFDFAVGDEIVEFNGKPVSEEVDRIQKYISTGYDLTARKVAAWSVFYQRAARFPVTEGEKVKLKIRRGTSSVIDSVELKWDTKGERLDEVRDFGKKEEKPESIFQSLDGFQFGVDFGQLPNFDIATFKNPEFADRSFACSGKSRVKRPEGATVIMEAPFEAYYYPTEKGNIGYLRIPHYSPRDKNGQRTSAETEKRFSQYQYAIRELEANTVGLVIDQDHNCGGSVMYLERLLGLFMNDKYDPMLFELRANKEEYLGFKAWMDESFKHTVLYQSVQTVLESIKKAWQAEEYLTEKMPIWGKTYGQYIPNQYNYTKPILVLIDEISGSGGDAFPALMGGYGRATLLGTRTSGLGGHVEIPGPLYYSRMNLRITKSLFYRPDGVAVENNGAVPDVSYSMTRDDVMYGYQPYREFYTSEILKLVK